MATRITRTPQIIELSTAVEQLEQLTDFLETDKKALVAAAPSLLQRIYHFGQWLFTKHPTSSIPQAIAKITQALPLISQLENEGNHEQRILAQRAIQVIDKYNRAIAHIANRRATLSIDLSAEITFEAIVCPKRKVVIGGRDDFQVKVGDAFRSQLASEGALNAKVLDLFHMKAITCLEGYGVSLPEAIGAVKSAQAKVVQESADVFHVMQTVTFFPGEKLVLTASFESMGGKVAQPLFRHCQLFQVAMQTGFPAACQYTGGWVLGHVLWPQGLELRWREMYSKGRELAALLLPGGSCHGVAQQLLKVKREVLRQHRDEFLELHEALARRLLAAAEVGEGGMAVMQTFFARVREAVHPFDRLAEAYQSFVDHYIAAPAWEADDSASLEREFVATAATVAAQMSGVASPIVRCTWEYVAVLGEALAPSLARLLLWHRGFPPESPLTPMEQLLLKALYDQQATFYEELHRPVTEEAVYSNLKRVLTQELEPKNIDIIQAN